MKVYDPYGQETLFQLANRITISYNYIGNWRIERGVEEDEEWNSDE